MSKVALAKRIGTMLRLVESGGQAEIVCSYKISGDFPAHRSIEVVFDFAKMPDGQIIVHLSRSTGRKIRLRKSWPLSEIERYDWVKSEGAKEFAASLGIIPSQLAKLIEGFKPVD